MSRLTTSFGPRVSFNTTTGGDAAGDTVGLFEVQVPLEVNQSLKLLGTANNTTADPDTTLLADGQFSITSVSVTSAVIAFRSGNTVYTFANDGTEA